MIETTRLLLRPPAVSDREWFAAHMNTPGVTRHLGGVKDDAAFAAGFERCLRSFAETGMGFFTVLLRESGEWVGKCGLGPIETDHAPPELRGEIQIGWQLAEPFWGKGLAAEAARAVLDRGFGAHETIYAQTSDSNRASTRLMARLGFLRATQLDYVDPAYPAADNPTTVYRMARHTWATIS